MAWLGKGVRIRASTGHEGCVRRYGSCWKVGTNEQLGTAFSGAIFPMSHDVMTGMGMGMGMGMFAILFA